MNVWLKFAFWPIDRILAYTGLAIVHVYRWVFSKRKGYSCSHNALHGKGSCSDIAIDLLKDRSFFTAIRMIRVQIQSCNETHAALKRDVFDTANKSLNAIGILVVTGAIAGCGCSDDGGGEGPFGKNMHSIDEMQEKLVQNKELRRAETDSANG